jgi:hypothetical protein
LTGRSIRYGCLRGESGDKPLFVFNHLGDLERCALRRGNATLSRLECGTGTDRVALPEQKGRGDGAFASPDLDEFLEVEGVGYSIPLSANRVLQENKGWEGMKDANKTVNAHRLVVIIEGEKSDWNELTSLSRHGCLWRNASSNYGDR